MLSALCARAKPLWVRSDHVMYLISLYLCLSLINSCNLEARPPFWFAKKNSDFDHYKCPCKFEIE